MIDLKKEESDVLALVVSGDNTSTIANALNIKEGRVERIRSSLISKFNVNHSADLAIKILNEGGLKKYPTITDGEGDEIQVSRTKWYEIKSFQAATLNKEDWKEFDKLIMTADNGKPIVGNQFYDWAGLIKKHPKFEDSIKQLSINGFNSVMEFTALKDGELVARCSLVNVPRWIEKDEG